MLFIFNVSPLILLTLYPFKFFQRFLNRLPGTKYKLALRLFMDTFHGCYKDGEHDYRHFAALYLAVRFLNLLLLSVLRSTNAYCIAATLLMAITLTLVANFHPYKRQSTNTVDIVMLLTLTTGCVSVAFWYTSGVRYPKWIFGIVLSFIALVPPGYIFCLAIVYIKPKILGCFKRIKIHFLERKSQHESGEDDDNSTLLNRGNTDYNTFTNCTTIDVVCSQ